MDVLFVASVGVVAADPPESRKLYVDALGLPLKGHEGDEYYSRKEIGGSKHFRRVAAVPGRQGLLPLERMAVGRPLPQVSLEFEVADAEAVGTAAAELEERGFELLHPPREEPCGGQTVVRLLSVEGRSWGSRTPPGCTTAPGTPARDPLSPLGGGPRAPGCRGCGSATAWRAAPAPRSPRRPGRRPGSRRSARSGYGTSRSPRSRSRTGSPARARRRSAARC